MQQVKTYTSGLFKGEARYQFLRNLKKKDGLLCLRYHHTTTLNKDHDELKTSMALISVLVLRTVW